MGAAVFSSTSWSLFIIMGSWSPLFVCFLPTAGEMLHVAEAFLEKNYHPTVICRGMLALWIAYCCHVTHVVFILTNAFCSAAYIKALEDSIAVLDKIAMSIDINDRKSISTLYLFIWSWPSATLVSEVSFSFTFVLMEECVSCRFTSARISQELHRDKVH
jgi:hypothetical protein